MESLFTEAQQDAVRRLLEPSRAQKPDSGAAGRQLQIEAVRRALDLPPIPYAQFLGPDCWLAGGGVLRWLCDSQDKGDFDFFFASHQAFDATARAMLAQGFRVRGYRFWARTKEEFLSGSFNSDKDSPIWRADGQLARLDSALIGELQLLYLELQSPSGDAIQLVANCFDTPLDTVLSFDLSICQFIVDGQHLSFGFWSMEDLLQNRWRHVDLKWPQNTFRRMIRYGRRGFLPYPWTALRVSLKFLSYKVSYFLKKAGRLVHANLAPG